MHGPEDNGTELFRDHEKQSCCVDGIVFFEKQAIMNDVSCTRWRRTCCVKQLRQGRVALLSLGESAGVREVGGNKSQTVIETFFFTRDRREW